MSRGRTFRPVAAAGLAVAALITLSSTAPAASASAPRTDAPAATQAHARITPAYVLPGDRVYPEGIAADPRTGELYAGSVHDGTIFKITPGHRTAAVFLPAGADGRTSAVGMKVDRAGRLWVIDPAGVTLYDVRTRARVARFDSPYPGATFVNDLAIAPDGSGYLTDSTQAVVYRVTPAQVRQAAATGGRARLAVRYDLSGLVPAHAPDAYTLNGIVADRTGRYLIAVDMTSGELYRLDVASGAVRKVAVDGPALVHADGMVMEHGRLWVAHNASDTITRWRVSRDGTSVRLERRLTDPALQTPTTLARVHGRLLVVRSQFTKGGPMGPGTPEIPFTIAEVDGI